MSDHGELRAALRRLIAGFPDVPPDAISSLLSDSYILVCRAAGEPLVGKAVELAILRLELRTRHPMVPPAE